MGFLIFNLFTLNALFYVAYFIIVEYEICFEKLTNKTFKEVCEVAGTFVGIINFIWWAGFCIYYTSFTH